MKKGTIIKRTLLGDYVHVKVSTSGDPNTPCYQFLKKNEFKHPYLSDENLSYYIAYRNQDEEDSYLLSKALQCDKKLCATFYTRNKNAILKIFEDKTRYATNVLNPDKEYSTVVVARTGCLADYYNIDDVLDWYDNPENGMKAFINYSLFESMAKEPMINLLSGDYCQSDVNYSIMIDFSGDVVVDTYKSVGLIIAGLLLGYPLESTVSLINQLWVSHLL